MRRPAFLIWTIFLLIIVLAFFGLNSHSQSWYFQDETEHVAIGWMVFNFGRRLYSDLITNHQPLPVLFGGALVKILPYNSLYLLVERLRLVMFGGQLLWGVFLIARFRWRGLLTFGALLSLSYWYFGWHVLAESLAAPAVSALMLYVLSWSEGQVRRFDSPLIGLLLFLSAFTLLPLWPFVALTGLWFLWRMNRSQRLQLLAFGLLPTLLLFLVVSPIDWFRATVIFNWQYYLPHEGQNSLWIFLVYPFLNLFELSSPIGRWFWLTLPLIGLALWKRKKKWLFPLALLWILNTRVSQPNATFYLGFHLFPYLAGWSALAAAAGVQLWSHARRRLSFVILAILFLAMAVNNFSWVAERKDKMNEYAIAYDTWQAMANAINTIKKSGDTLLTGGDGTGYLNILAGLPMADNQNFHINLFWRPEEQRIKFARLMTEQPPTFIYFQTNERNDYYLYLQPILAEEYLHLRRADGRLTDLYFLRKAAAQTTSEQWQALADQYFTLPDLNSGN